MCSLCEEVGVFVVFVVGDFFWRSPLLFPSIFVVTDSCLNFGWLRCLVCFEDRELVSICYLVWLAMLFFWWTGGEGCPFYLVLKSGGSIAFDTRSGVSSLVHVWFWAFFGVLLMNQG